MAGGTSAATPSFAGMLTLLTQKYGTQGNINPTLYQLASPSIFNYTASGGNNIVACEVNATTDPGCPSSEQFGYSISSLGYNLVTGLGSINGGALYTAMGGATKVTVSPGTVTLGQTTNLLLTATVISSSATGTVTFTVGGISLGTATVTNGTATLTTTVTPSAAIGFSQGSDAITAGYSGDTNYPSSVGATTLTVIGVNTTTTDTATPNVLAIGGAPTTLTATVSPSSATGTVTFKVGNVVTSVPVSGGVATLGPLAVTAANGFTVGTDTITASYSGDMTYVSSGNSTNVTLPGYTIAQPANPAAIKAGDGTSVTLNLTSLGGYAGTVSFNAVVSSANVSASASQVTLTAGGNGTSTVTITTTTSAANHAPAMPWKSGGAVLFCAVLLGPVALRRRRTLAVLLAALTISLVGLLISCGGGGSAARTYAVTLTPTGSGSMVTNPAAMTFVVTVQ